MAFKLAEAFVELNERGFRGVTGKIDRMKGSLRSMGSVGAGATSLFTSGMMGIAKATAAASAASVAAVGLVGVATVRSAAKAEQFAVALEVLTGSASKAKTALGQLESFAASTPLQQDEINRAARSLLSFGTTAEDLVPTLKTIGDLSSGIQAPISEIAEIFGKAKVQGRLFMEDINQLTGRGIPVIGELAKQFGVAESEVRGLVSSGEVNFTHLEKAFQSLTSEGGRFEGMMQKQSLTVLGLWSTFKDNIGLIMKDIGFGFIDAFDIRDSIRGMTKSVQRIRDSLGPIIETVVPSVQGVIGEASEMFQELWGTVGSGSGPTEIFINGLQAMGNGLSWVLDRVAFVMDNWRTVWQMGGEFARLTFSNISQIVDTWGKNSTKVASWFRDQWLNILIDIGNATRIAFENISHNAVASMNQGNNKIAGLLVRYRALVEGVSKEELQQRLDSLGEIQVDSNFKNLFDGFKSTVEELPQLASANVSWTNQELQKLAKQMDYTHLLPDEIKAPILDLKEVAEKGKSVGGSFANGVKSVVEKNKINASSMFIGVADLGSKIQSAALNRNEKDSKKGITNSKSLSGVLAGGLGAVLGQGPKPHPLQKVGHKVNQKETKTANDQLKAMKNISKHMDDWAQSGLKIEPQPAVAG